MINRNIIILFFSQSLGYSSISFLILVSSILATQMGPSKNFSTLPLTLSIIGTATATIPAAMLMKLIGRKRGFLIAYCIAILGSILGLLSVLQHSFTLLCGCTFLTGCFLAFAHQFRFAAIESLENPKYTAQAISFLLLGGIVAAVLGPQLGEWGKNLLPQAFSGSFLLLILVYIVSALIFLGFQNPQPRIEEKSDAKPRSLITLFRQPVLLIAICSAVVAYSVMSFIMTATPISMHYIDDFNFSEAKGVIQLHVASMFIPSLFSIALFRIIGLEKLLVSGAIIYLIMGFIALQGHGYIHYTSSLIMLGVGWNFLFVSGTTLLSQTYTYHERFKVQAANDFIVYTVQAISSLSAGWLLFSIGWDSMIKITLPLSMTMLIITVVYWRTMVRINNKEADLGMIRS